MIGATDSRQIIYLPFWTKAVVTILFVIGLAVSLAVIVRFIGSDDSLDWLLLGVSGVQFGMTALATFLVLCFSQTDANIRNLERRTEQFLRQVVPDKLGRITYPGMTADRLAVSCGERRDLFGYPIEIADAGRPILRLWCGVNVSRIIVIYRVENPRPGVSKANFLERLRQIFAFTLGGAEAVGYAVNYEPVPGSPKLVSIWVTVAASPDLLTDSAQKLFWAQDIAMMTESLLRTARRHADEVRPDLVTQPAPL